MPAWSGRVSAAIAVGTATALLGVPASGSTYGMSGQFYYEHVYDPTEVYAAITFKSEGSEMGVRRRSGILEAIRAQSPAIG
jgi:hypothetical protein